MKAAVPEVQRPPEGISIPDVGNEVAVIRPSRELDCSTGPELVQRLGRLLRSSAVDEIAIPLDGVDFIDAAGMRALVTCYKLALRSRRSITFPDPSPAVRRLVDILGEAVLPIGSTTPCGS